MTTLYYESELFHYGIKGMKWGVRRYRNENGNLTSAGKKRYDRDYQDHGGDKLHKYSDKYNNNTPRSKIYQPNPDKWAREDLSRAKKLSDASANLVGQAKTINQKAVDNRSKNKMDLSEMSDKELRDKINRALLERQYNDIFAAQAVPTGRDKVNKILETTGDVLKVGSSLLGVALAVKEIMG